MPECAYVTVASFNIVILIFQIDSPRGFHLHLFLVKREYKTSLPSLKHVKIIDSLICTENINPDIKEIEKSTPVR